MNSQTQVPIYGVCVTLFLVSIATFICGLWIAFGGVDTTFKKWIVLIGFSVLALISFLSAKQLWTAQEPEKLLSTVRNV